MTSRWVLATSGRRLLRVRLPLREKISSGILGYRSDAEWRWLLGKILLEPPVGDLDAGRKPHTFMSFHVFDHLFERAGPTQSAGHVRMQLERGKQRPERRFLV